MSLKSFHPSYTQFSEDWEMLRDTHAGERVVKSKGVKYLPATAGQVLDGQGKTNTDGERSYQAYKMRAVFPEYVSEAVEEFVGLMHKRPATFELPKAMEALVTSASADGEGLQALLRRINTEQLTEGRLGLLLDFPKEFDGNKPLPYIALYSTESVINWDASHDRVGVDNLELVVLNESGITRKGFQWESAERYRVLRMVDREEYAVNGAPGSLALMTQNPVPDTESTKVYVQGVFDTDIGEEVLANYAPPVYLGQPLSKLPFVFVNTKDILSEPDKPPLAPLARMCLTIYRGEADYRQNLYMQSQDTLVTIGSLTNTGDTVNNSSGDGLRVGAGAHIGLDMGGDAKYIGVQSTGIAEQRSSNG
jgi:hypothetical protein